MCAVRPWLLDHRIEGSSYRTVAPSRVPECRSYLAITLRRPTAFTIRRPDRPRRRRRLATDGGGPICATLLTAPMSFPSSSVFVQTAVAGRSDCRSASSVSARISRGFRDAGFMCCGRRRADGETSRWIAVVVASTRDVSASANPQLLDGSKQVARSDRFASLHRPTSGLIHGEFDVGEG